MGDVLLFTGENVVPWYARPDLVADETGIGLLRFLPEQTYVPVEHVVAVLTTAVWWQKTVSVSWMEMEYDGIRGCEVPIQRHRKGAAVVYIDDDSLEGFGVMGPEDLEGEQRVAMNCVTDIAVDLDLPTPKKPEAQLPSGLQVDG